MQGFVLKRIAKTLILGAGLVMAAGPAMAANSPLGWWLDQTGKGGVYIYQCGQYLCGKVEWLRTPLNKDGKPVEDVLNSNASLRTRQLCGILTMGNFVADGPNAWKGGWIYDAANGKTYDSVMHLKDDGTLVVRGYIGTPMFGRSETWTRPTATLTPCTPLPGQ